MSCTQVVLFVYTHVPRLLRRSASAPSRRHGRLVPQNDQLLLLLLYPLDERLLLAAHLPVWRAPGREWMGGYIVFGVELMGWHG